MSEIPCGRKGHEMLVQTYDDNPNSTTPAHAGDFLGLLIFREYNVSMIYEADL